MTVPAYFDHSAIYKDAFKESDLAGLTARLLNRPNSPEFGNLKIPASRYVYRLGSFTLQEVQQHAILKIYPRTHAFERVTFETAFFAACTASDVDVPSFSLVAMSKTSDFYGIIEHDITEGKYHVLEMFNEVILRHLEGYPESRDIHFSRMRNAIASLDEDALPFFRSPSGETVLKGTSFAVVDGQTLKRIVCADVDQIFEHFPYYNHSAIEGLHKILLTLD